MHQSRNKLNCSKIFDGAMRSRARVCARAYVRYTDEEREKAQKLKFDNKLAGSANWNDAPLSAFRSAANDIV